VEQKNETNKAEKGESPCVKTRPDIKIKSIAPCGMDCGTCSGYLRKKRVCLGCRSGDKNKPVYCKTCIMRNCTKRKGPYCNSCKEYPCPRLKRLDKRYRTRYGMSMIQNLDSIKTSGIRAFVKEERVRWACTACKGTVCVHNGYCSSCGKKEKNVERPVNLFKAKARSS